MAIINNKSTLWGTINIHCILWLCTAFMQSHLWLLLYVQTVHCRRAKLQLCILRSPVLKLFYSLTILWICHYVEFGCVNTNSWLMYLVNKATMYNLLKKDSWSLSLFPWSPNTDQCSKFLYLMIWRWDASISHLSPESYILRAFPLALLAASSLWVFSSQ